VLGFVQHASSWEIGDFFGGTYSILTPTVIKISQKSTGNQGAVFGFLCRWAMNVTAPLGGRGSCRAAGARMPEPSWCSVGPRGRGFGLPKGA
jgi:hypothetical protein